MGSLWSINEILKFAQGQLIFHDPVLSLNQRFLEIQTDSRKPLKDKAFLALRGNFFDGHQFTYRAYQKGARLLIVDSFSCFFDERLKSPWPKSLKLKDFKPKHFSFRKRDLKEIKNLLEKLNLKKTSIIQVKDTLRSLALLGQHCREKKLRNAQIIAITGSAGKTTTKEFTKTLLEKSFKVYASPKSFNNHLGVPLSLLEAPPESQVIVLEIGMNRKGEIENLCKLAKPHVCLVTNVGLAHRGFFKSQLEIANEKEKIYSSAPKKAHFVFNYDDSLTYKMFKKFKKRKKKSFSFFSSKERKAPVFMGIESLTWNGIRIKGQIQSVKGSSSVPVFGKQNLVNLMGASALALQIGLQPKTIWSTLRRCKNSWGRGKWFILPSGIRILFDAYNASPESVFVLLENIYEIKQEEKRKNAFKGTQKKKGKTIAVFAEMMELGSQSRKLHYEWGKRSRVLNLDILWFLGPHFKSFQKGFEEKEGKKNCVSSNLSTQCHFTKDYDDGIFRKIGLRLKRGDLIFIKGSRAMKLERILNDLKSKK